MGGEGRRKEGKRERGRRGKEEKEGKDSGLVWGKDNNTCRWDQIGRMCGFVLGGRKGLGGGSQGSGWVRR